MSDDSRSQPFPWRFTLPLYLGSTLNPINSSLIATALVPIAAALRVPVGHVASLVAAVYLTSAVAQPTAGKLAEVFGPRRVFLTGTLCILAAGVIGGLAHSLGMLILARVFIGLGSSTAYPSAMLIVRRRAAAAGMSEPPGGVLGGLAIAGMAIAALGLPFGGVLVGIAGWQATFIVNIPVAVVTLLAALFWLPADGALKEAGGNLSRIDFGGIVLFGGTITSTLIFLLSLPALHWLPLAIAVAACSGLVVWELKAHTPFIDLRLLARNLALTRTYLRVALTSLVMYGAMYGVSQWLEPGHHLSPEQTGLLVLPMAIVAPIVSFPVSRRNLIRGPILVTGAALIVGSVGVLLTNAHTSVVFIAAVMLVFGVSMGLFTVSNQTALYSQAPDTVIGTAAGLFRTFAYLGSIGSSAVTGIVFRSTVNDGGLHTMGWLFLAAGVVVLAMTIADRKLVTARPAGVTATGAR